MDLAIYACVALSLIIAALCVLILIQAGRPPTVLERFAIRFSDLEQVAGALPGALREESRTGREETRAVTRKLREVEALDATDAPSLLDELLTEASDEKEADPVG